MNDPDPAETMFSADFDGLRAGDSYRSQACPIASRDVLMFAALTGDEHPIHVDARWAEESGPFGRRIAHGMLVLSCAVGVLPLDPDRVIALRRIRDAVFKRPVAVDEAIVVDCVVSELKPLDSETGLVECEWRISGEDGRLRSRATVEIVWRRGGPKRQPAADDAIGHGDELAPVQVSAPDDVRVLI